MVTMLPKWVWLFMYHGNQVVFNEPKNQIHFLKTLILYNFRSRRRYPFYTIRDMSFTGMCVLAVFSSRKRELGNLAASNSRVSRKIFPN
jgi:hypothetical protein